MIDVKVFTREGIERDKRAQLIIDEELRGYKKDSADQRASSKTTRLSALNVSLIGKTPAAA